MQKQKYMPYFFDYKYEKRTYKYIGKDYGDRITYNKSWNRNFTRWYRKCIYNRKESKYKRCNTYNEWKLYILKRQFNSECEKENMKRYLIRKKQDAETIFEISKTLFVPFYISMFSIVVGSEAEEPIFWIIISTFFIIFFCTYLIFSSKKNVDFYKDYVECLENVEK